MTWDFGIASSSGLWRCRAACWAVVLYSAPRCNCTVEIARASDGLRRYYHCASWNCISVVVHPRLAVNEARQGRLAVRAQTYGEVESPQLCPEVWSNSHALGQFSMDIYLTSSYGKGFFCLLNLWCFRADVSANPWWLSASGAVASLSHNWWKPQEGLLFLCWEHSLDILPFVSFLLPLLLFSFFFPFFFFSFSFLVSEMLLTLICRVASWEWKIDGGLSQCEIRLSLLSYRVSKMS